MDLREIVSYLFSQNHSKYQIDLFDPWHFLYLFMVFGGAILLAVLWRNRSEESKDKLIRLMAILTIGLYIIDFFCMPLSRCYQHTCLMLHKMGCVFIFCDYMYKCLIAVYIFKKKLVNNMFIKYNMFIETG